MYFFLYLSFRASLLKSDQNGIEMPHHLLLQQSTIRIKIRPKWDWNFSLLFFLFFLKNVLKSDQNGIEIGDELRGEAYIDEIKIRPKWDWNLQAGQSHFKSFSY